MKVLARGLGVCLLAGAAVLAQDRSRGFVNGQSVVSISALGQHGLNKKAINLSKQAMREYFRRHYEQALALLQRALVQEPKAWSLENDLGVVYSSLGKDTEAESAFELASKENGASAVSYMNLAAVSFNIYDYRMSEGAARAALRIDPRFSQAQMMLGLAEVAQDHWTGEARRYLEENREQYHQAQVVLEHWPKLDDSDHSTAPSIRGAGPGALAGTTAQLLQTEHLTLSEK